MYSFPNQRMIHIHREKLNGMFLGIQKENFINAYKDLNATALALYLYLASNKEGYQFAFSPAAVEKELGMPSSTCKDQVKKLIDKGYLVLRKEGSNIYDFYETPKKSSEIGSFEQEEKEQEASTDQEYRTTREFFDASCF